MEITEKFLPIYEGPYIIMKNKNNATYTLKKINNNKIRGIFHGSELRPYYNRLSINTDESQNNIIAEITNSVLNIMATCEDHAGK